MKRPRGLTLLEMLVYVTLLLFALNAIMLMLYSLLAAHERTTRATSDFWIADRFLRNVKEDLRRASMLAVEPQALRLTFGETSAVYAFDEAEATVRRTGDGPERIYLEAFNSVTFREEADRTVSVEISLVRRRKDLFFQPRLQATVFCRNLP